MLLDSCWLLAGVAVLVIHRDIAYGAVLIWALTAIVAKQDRVPVGNAAIGCIAVTGLGIAYAVFQKSPETHFKPLGAYTEL